MGNRSWPLSARCLSVSDSRSRLSEAVERYCAKPFHDDVVKALELNLDPPEVWAAANTYVA